MVLHGCITAQPSAPHAELSDLFLAMCIPSQPGRAHSHTHASIHLLHPWPHFYHALRPPARLARPPSYSPSPQKSLGAVDDGSGPVASSRPTMMRPTSGGGGSDYIGRKVRSFCYGGAGEGGRGQRRLHPLRCNESVQLKQYNGAFPPLPPFPSVPPAQVCRFGVEEGKWYDSIFPPPPSPFHFPAQVRRFWVDETTACFPFPPSVPPAQVRRFWVEEGK